MGRTSIILKVVSFFLGVTILAKWRFWGQGNCPSRKPFHSWINFSNMQSGTHIKSGWVQPQHPGEVVVWFGEWLVSNRLTESVCRLTMFSILEELISTSHEHVDQSRLHGSKSVPNHERKHLEALRIKFGPFKLNRDRFSKSSFMNPQSWMFRMWHEEGRFGL